jgi:hypothetical protein
MQKKLKGSTDLEIAGSEAQPFGRLNQLHRLHGYKAGQRRSLMHLM